MENKIMLKRYDIATDEMVELTQEWIDNQSKIYQAMAIHYKEHSPENFKKFRENYILTGK